MLIGIAADELDHAVLVNRLLRDYANLRHDGVDTSPSSWPTARRSTNWVVGIGSLWHRPNRYGPSG
jgi:hypothetical protein